jgi:hypothetical protein
MNDHDQLLLMIHNQLQDAISEGTQEEMLTRVASVIAFIRAEIRPEITPTEEEFVRNLKIVDD